ncbi:MAG: hypothetical protein E7463_07140 [Ruminococcaceae bacterium]|nr:hypothetical protein [Oscillospiraceae bacterium]
MFTITDYGVMPNAPHLQTEQIQAVLDLCRDSGGTVVIPAGTYRVSSLRMWSDTTLLLKTGALLLGSDNCDDYEVFAIPAGMQLYSDQEVLHDSKHTPRPEYRRAMITSYAERNIAIIGEPGSVIDGQDCYDPDGEEHYRGPHGIFLSNCENITLRGYTIRHSGNFCHQLDNCTHVTMTDVTALGASDAIHLHYGSDMLIERCIFRTGDDCIAGANVRDLHVNNCVLNTACNVFRLGGCDILIENCHICGPGYYPHRMTIVKSKDEILPREAGRHNTLSLFIFFASETFPAPVHSHNIVLRNLTVENVRWLLQYYADSRHHFQYGDRLRDITFDNIRLTGIEQKPVIKAPDDEPLTVRVRDVSVEYCDPDLGTELFAAESLNLILENF